MHFPINSSRVFAFYYFVQYSIMAVQTNRLWCSLNNWLSGQVVFKFVLTLLTYCKGK